MAAAGRGNAAFLEKERAAALNQMNLVKIVRAYVKQMVDEVSGYKALVLDKETMRTCVSLFGRTELGEHNVVHVERLDANDGKEHLELKVCVVVLFVCVSVLRRSG